MGEKMQKDNQPHEKVIFKEREFQRIFEGIEDELAILTANAKFYYTTSKTDENTLKLTLAYIDDTKKLIELLKNVRTCLWKPQIKLLLPKFGGAVSNQGCDCASGNS